MKNLLSPLETHALTELKEAINRKYELLWIKLFGSKARGDFDEESDIDLVIALKSVDWAIEKDIYEICFYIGLRYDLLLSPVLYSEREIAEDLNKETPFYKTVEAEGVLL